MDVTIPCPCPTGDGTPRHESDTVTLRDTLDFHQATTITKAVQFIDNDDPGSRAAEVLATLSEFYVLVGVERWTLRDVSNKPVPVNKGEIRKAILDRPEIASLVADVADDLYSEAILLPLARKAASSSSPSPTETPTSPTPHGGRPRHPKPSKRSSITTIPTDATEATSSSLDGVSSSSLKSESAA